MKSEKEKNEEKGDYDGGWEKNQIADPGRSLPTAAEKGKESAP